MNLPIFFDIAIGLFFIYLILSLLAFEIQELIATFFQWRAIHLEKAIQSLLCGGSEYFSKNELEKAKAKVENAQAERGKAIAEVEKAEREKAIAEVKKARKLVIALYNDPLINTLNHEAKDRGEKFFREGKKLIDPHSSIAGRNSRSSYIPSETFASTLFNELKLPHLIEKIKKNQKLETNLILIFSSYKELKTAVLNKESESYRKIVKIYGEIDKDFEKLINELSEDVPESLIKSLEVLARRSQNKVEIDKDFEKLINELPDDVPESLIKSLEFLARRSQNKVEEIDEQLNQLRKEVETWFDRSMARATGLYKRNAKGVAILIGIAIAILTNTDTFYIVSRLSKDTVLRTALTTSASQQAQFFDDPKIFQIKINQALEDVFLPVGWSPNNFREQFGFNININNIKQYKFDFWNLLKTLQVVLGWFLSGFAIAMGAPFWFDLLGKIINMRNAGPIPKSYTKDQPSGSKD